MSKEDDYILENYAEPGDNEIVFENKDRGYFITAKKVDEQDRENITSFKNDEMMYLVYQKDAEHPQGNLIGGTSEAYLFKDEKNGVVNLEFAKTKDGFSFEARVVQFDKNGNFERIESNEGVDASNARYYVTPDLLSVRDWERNKFLYNAKTKTVEGNRFLRVSDNVVQYLKDNEIHVCLQENNELKELAKVKARGDDMHTLLWHEGNDIYWLADELVDVLEPNKKTTRGERFDFNGEMACLSKQGLKVLREDLSNLSEEEFIKNMPTLLGRKRTSDRYGAAIEKTLWANFADYPQKRAAYASYIAENEYNQSYGDKIKLIEMINETEAREEDMLENSENDLRSLRGMSLNDVDSSSLLEVFDTSHLLPLVEVNVDYKETPAAALITEKYRERYGSGVVDILAEHAREVIKLPYKGEFLERCLKNVSQEANFLDAYTAKLKDLAIRKYGEKDNWWCLSNQMKNPKFMKDADAIWNNMMETPDKYAIMRKNDNNNAFIRKSFPDKVAELHAYVENTKGPEKRVLDGIEYFQRVGKMMHVIKDYCKEKGCYLNGNLHFDLVDAGVKTARDAKRCLDIWNASNERPDRYGSPYNTYMIAEIAQVAKTEVLQDWMYPVMIGAIEKGGLSVSDGRMPSERTLFDCCKAWKICPEMPQRLAEKVGRHSLYGRMLAGAIFDQMSEKGKTDPSEWKENKNLHEKFFEELSRAEKMERTKALKQYIPNTAVNRKRLVGAGMEEKGIENTPDNFRTLYREMREKGIFDKMLAKPKEAKTTFNARLLVDVARRKQAKSK